MLKLLLMTILYSIAGVSLASVSVIDDTGQEIVIDAPARRIISLSPGMTELIFAAGGGDFIKGVVSYSDYPEAAKAIQQVGGYNSVDIEKIVALNPDLIFAWESGNPPQQIAKLKQLDLKVYTSEPRDFDDIPETMLRLGKLMNTNTIASNSASEFRSTLKRLSERYSKDKTKPKSVFIQIWNQPLMTVNGDHLISKIVEFCNGQNIFHDAVTLTLTLDVETILQKNPEIIIVSRQDELGNEWLDRWRQWDFLAAVKNKEMYTANQDHLVRHSPRIVKGIEQVCGLLQQDFDESR